MMSTGDNKKELPGTPGTPTPLDRLLERFPPPGVAALADPPAAHGEVGPLVAAPTPSPALPWDAAGAERTLRDLTTELLRIECQVYRGRFPDRVRSVVDIGLEMCRGYVANHQLEAARGYDPMELLRSGAAWTVAVAKGRPPVTPVTGAA